MSALAPYFADCRKNGRLGLVMYTVYAYPTLAVWTETMRILGRFPVLFETSIALRVSTGVGDEVGRALRSMIDGQIDARQVAEAFAPYRPNAVIVHQADRMSTAERDAVFTAVDGRFDAALPSEGDDAAYAQCTTGRIAEAWPTMTDTELERAARLATGFIYLQSAPITGGARFPIATLGAAIARIRERSEVPICCGFGIRSPEQVAELATLDGCSGAIIGSELVRRMAAAVDGEMTDVERYVEAIAAAAVRS